MAGIDAYFQVFDKVAFASDADKTAFVQHYRPAFESPEWPLERNAANERYVQELASHVVFSRLADRDLVEEALLGTPAFGGGPRQVNKIGTMTAIGDGYINYAPKVSS